MPVRHERNQENAEVAFLIALRWGFGRYLMAPKALGPGECMATLMAVLWLSACLALLVSVVLSWRGLRDQADAWRGLAFLLLVPAAGLRIYEFSSRPTPEQAAEARLNALEAARIAATPEGLAKEIYYKSGDLLPTVVQEEGGRILVTATTSNFLTASLLHYEALGQAKKYLSRVFAANNSVKRVDIVHRATLVDVRGNVSTAPVLRVSMRSATAATINWENFDPGNFHVVADTYWEHPALNR